MDDQRDQPVGTELAEREVAHRAGRLGGEALAPVVVPERVADLYFGRSVRCGGPRSRLPGLRVPNQQADAADHHLVLLAHGREESEAVGLPALDHAPHRALGLSLRERAAVADVAHHLGVGVHRRERVRVFRDWRAQQ